MRHTFGEALNTKSAHSYDDKHAIETKEVHMLDKVEYTKKRKCRRGPFYLLSLSTRAYTQSAFGNRHANYSHIVGFDSQVLRELSSIEGISVSLVAGHTTELRFVSLNDRPVPHATGLDSLMAEHFVFRNAIMSLWTPSAPSLSSHALQTPCDS